MNDILTISLRTRVPRRCAFIAVAGMLAIFTTGAKAQQPVYLDNESVTVDLSVLDDGGYGLNNSTAENSTAETGAAITPMLSARGSRLALPLLQPPVSRLHVSPPVIKFHPLKKASRKAHKNVRAVKIPARPTPPRAPDKPSASVAAVTPPVSPSVSPTPTAEPAVKQSTAKSVALKETPAKQSEAASIKAPTAPLPMAEPKSPPVAPVAKPMVAVVKAPEPPHVDKVEPPVVTASGTQKTTAENQLASLPSAGKLLKSGLAYQVIFANDASKLPLKHKKGLKLLAEKMKDNANARLQLHAYAGDASLSSSKARRLSLSRALSVRSYLIESGIRSTRIDVRALGNKTKGKPLNRVDINVVQR